MTRFVFELGDAWRSSVDIALRCALVLAVTAVLTLLLRRRSAATRHLAWTAAVCGVLVLPLIAGIAPGWRVLPPEHHAVDVAQPARIESTSMTQVRSRDLASERTWQALLDAPLVVATMNDQVVESDSKPVIQERPIWRRLDVRHVVAAVWLMGICVLLLPMLLGSVSVRQLRRTGQPMSGELAEQLNQLTTRLGIRRRVIGLLTAERSMPMTWGWWQPVVLLPSEAASWSPERRRLVLLHELAHVRRFDCVTQLVAQLVRALHWFNPLAWYALRQVRIEQEQACDDYVLNSGASATDYAAELLSVTARLPRATWDTAVALAMSRATRLEQRLAAILNVDCERHPISTPRMTALVAMIGILVTGIGAAQRQTAVAAPPMTKEIASSEEPAKQSEQQASEAKTIAPADATKGTVSITNGDFEGEVQPHRDPPGWHATRLPRTAQFTKFAREDSGHGGKHSVSIHIKQTHPAEAVGYNWVTELTGWKSEQAFEVSGWVKTENVSVSPHLFISCSGKSDKPLAYASTFEKHPVVGTKDWTRIVTAIVIPQGTERVVLRATLLAPANRGGTVWFDDFAVAETTIEAASKTTVTPNSATQQGGPKAAKPEAEPAKDAVAEKTPSLEAVIRQIEQSSAVPIDKSTLNDAAIRGALESLKDPYSAMLSAEQMKELHVQIDGELVGIGAALKKDGNAIEVSSVMPNSPAIRGGLKPQDVILEIDGQPAKELGESVKQIRGQAGTEVTLKILRANKPESLTLKRAQFRLPTVKGLSLDEQGKWRHWLDADQKIAFVQITQFDKATPNDLKDALSGLKEQGLKGLILDLRGNVGGLLASSDATARLFLKEGTIVEVRGRHAQENAKLEIPAGHVPLLAETPLIVLIDPTTASAAEVLAAALKDNNRATLLGERTFGKGSVQSILPVGNDGSSLKLTTALMLSPSGQSFHRVADSKTWGVDPHDGYFVPLTTEQRAMRQKLAVARETGALKLEATVSPEFLEQGAADSQLAAAVKSLSAKLKTGEFAKTGRPLTDQQAELTQRDNLLKQRDELRGKLEHLNRQLGESS